MATLLITNSHFGNIWPISALATGGLLGNVIFFAASGFCLYRVKESFPRWYGRRFLKIYPIVAAFTLLAVFIGSYSVHTVLDAVALFIYPTNYIFVVWILLLYVPFYLVSYLDKRVKNFTEWALAVTAVLWIVTYILFFDKSYYHIDDVSSPFICFVYFAAMLIGALFQKAREQSWRGKVAYVAFADGRRLYLFWYEACVFPPFGRGTPFPTDKSTHAAFCASDAFCGIYGCRERFK